MSKFLPLSPLERAKRLWEDKQRPEPDPADGCLACGKASCDCDQRYEESRDER